MFRSLLTLALSLFLVAEASAQTPATTAPTAKVKSAKATARTARRADKKARRVALKSLPAQARLNDGWPPLEETQTVVASNAPVDATGADAMYGAAPASRGELDNANVYAAPGMPVHIRTSKVAVPYSVRPARKPASTQTTLGN